MCGAAKIYPKIEAPPLPFSAILKALFLNHPFEKLFSALSGRLECGKQQTHLEKQNTYGPKRKALCSVKIIVTRSVYYYPYFYLLCSFSSLPFNTYLLIYHSCSHTTFIPSVYSLCYFPLVSTHALLFFCFCASLPHTLLLRLHIVVHLHDKPIGFSTTQNQPSL